MNHITSHHTPRALDTRKLKEGERETEEGGIDRQAVQLCSQAIIVTTLTAPRRKLIRELMCDTTAPTCIDRYDEETTSILTEWFLSHKRWPYPAAKEKNALAEMTNLTTLQM